ncbi:MAG: zinc-ribbon and DUF3426 domain-containing protein [Gammaproteobacteria bacterium]
MYTFCPNCHATFRLTTRQLAKAGGRARCGECHEVYSAVDYLFEELDETREAQAQHREQVEALAALAAQEQADAEARAQAEAEAEAAAEQLAAAETAEQAESAAAELLADSKAAGAAEQPEVPLLKVPADGWSQSSLKMPNVFSGVAVVLLVLLIGAQWVFFNRAELAGNPQWRPHLEQVCSYLHCDLPLQVDLAQLELLNRDVRQHPRVEEALLVNATLSNRAEFTQPFPVLEVSFSDTGGNIVAARRFRPIEYIIDNYIIKRGMLPGEPVPVVLEIVDPGEVAASYQFGFL